MIANQFKGYSVRIVYVCLYSRLYDLLISVSLIGVVSILTSCSNNTNTQKGEEKKEMIVVGENRSVVSAQVPFYSQKTQNKISLNEPEAYLDWVEDPENGMIVTQEVGDMSYSLMFKPLDYVALKDLPGQTDMKTFSKIKDQYQTLQYFTLRIGSSVSDDLLRSGNATSEEYNRRVQYFSFHMQKDMMLVDGTDTLSCVMHHFERTYSLAPHRNFVLAFRQRPESKRDNWDDKTLIFEDQVFGKGRIKLKIKAENIVQIPQLALTKI